VAGNEKGGVFRRSLFQSLHGRTDYTQVITPLVMSQTLADCE
jgi:hypothetical protein